MIENHPLCNLPYFLTKSFTKLKFILIDLTDGAFTLNLRCKFEVFWFYWIPLTDNESTLNNLLFYFFFIDRINSVKVNIVKIIEHAEHLLKQRFHLDIKLVCVCSDLTKYVVVC